MYIALILIHIHNYTLHYKIIILVSMNFMDNPRIFVKKKMTVGLIDTSILFFLHLVLFIKSVFF